MEGMRVLLKMRSGRTGHLAANILLAWIAALGLAGFSSAATDNTPALRDLWLQSSDRFVRSWLLLGPTPATWAQLDSNISPTPGAAQPLGEGHTANWRLTVSYHDAVDLLEGPEPTLSRGHVADPEVTYASTTVNRDQEGDAVISLGTDNAVQVWVNGNLIHEQRADRAFEYDADEIPVRLRRGENRILLRIVRITGPSRLALRVLEPGTVRQRLMEIAPFVLPSGPGELIVTTHSRKEQGPAVQVDVLAAGGKSVAQSRDNRGETVHFDASAWPVGAYEIRFTTQRADGSRFASYLPWYKGDAVEAARRLLEQASTSSNDSAGMTTRMLAELVRDRLGNNLNAAPDDAWRSIHSALLEYEELAQARAGEPGPIHPGGFVRLAYDDEVDGSAQFCRAYLPPDYAATRAWPLIMFLHGYNPANPPYIRWWSVDERHSPLAETHHVIYVEPHARGNTQYYGIGERDVLRCLQEARQRLNVDERRIYLTGESMGGSGTWIIASRHPDLFAAAAPVFGGWDTRVASLNRVQIVPRQDNTAPELFVQEIQSSFAGAEGLLHVPLFVSHGDSDLTVNVDFSRHAVRMLQRWGYDLRYREHPGRGHESLNNSDEIADWMLTHERVTVPEHVRLRSGDLAGASAYWIQVEARQEPFQMMELDAEVIRPGLLRLDTRNVAQVRISPTAALLGTGTTGPLEVVWNGAHRQVQRSEGPLQLTLSGKPAEGGLNKRPELEGGLSRLIATPFALVIGTASADPAMRQLCQGKADAFVELWKQWQHVPPRVFRDDQITPVDLKRYSLLLIGGPGDNRITRQLASRLPLKVAGDGFTIDGRKYNAPDSVVQMIYPSPLAPDRYVSVVAGTSADGLYFWKPPLWDTSVGYPNNLWDWVIRDGRRVKLDSSALGAERGWVAAGMFDQHWRRDDRWVYPGDSALRRGSVLRHAPAAGFTVPGQLLDSYAGDYEFAPGATVHVSHEGSHLMATPSFSAPIRLDPESDTDFVVHDTTDSVYFVSDDRGQVSATVLNSDGQEISAKRIPRVH